MEVKDKFKLTAFGVIPTEWDFVPLKHLCKSISDGTHVTPRYVNSGIPFYSVENITADDFENTKFISENEHKQLIRRCKPQRGDILMTRITAGILGDTKLIDWDVDASIYVSLALLKLNNRVSSQYLYRYSRSHFFRDDVSSRGLENATPKKINMAAIGAIPIPVPPTKAEQEAIATALSDADGLIKSLERLIAKKRQIKQAAMQELLTGKKRLPGFSGEWAVTSVGSVIASYFCGPSPTCEERNISGDEEWGVLKTTASTKEQGWNWQKHKLLPPVFWKRHHIELKAGDVIVTKAGPRHRVGVAAWIDFVPSHIIPSGKMIALRPHMDKVVPLLLASAVSSKETQTFLDQRTTGMAESQVNFENEVLINAPIRLPKLTEQKAIASILLDIGIEIEALEAKLGKARQIKQGMMHNLLTGKIRLL